MSQITRPRSACPEGERRCHVDGAISCERLRRPAPFQRRRGPKFGGFADFARKNGAYFIATGHYARIVKTEHGLRLAAGVDASKDQSYFLHAVKREAFQKVLFPIGHLLKKEVRALARQHGLATAEKKDSTGICFIGKRDFKPFLSEFLGTSPGPFKTLSGKTVGQHDGAAFYTLGQRKGMGLGGEGDAWYVVGKDVPSNTVFVERGKNHPALFRSELQARELTWVDAAPPFPLRCTAKVRYRQTDTPCLLQESGHVLFDEPQRAITPGQSIVFYQGDVCLGGGVIALFEK